MFEIVTGKGQCETGVRDHTGLSLVLLEASFSFLALRRVASARAVKGPVHLVQLPKHTVHPDHGQAKVATRGEVEPVEAILQSAAITRHKQRVSAIYHFINVKRDRSKK
jgi:hypothetical protein